MAKPVKQLVNRGLILHTRYKITHPRQVVLAKALILVPAMAVVLVLVAGSVYHPIFLSAEERERVDTALNQRFDLATLRYNREVAQLDPITHEGEESGGTGGPLSNITENRNHVVQAGETLSGIADLYGMSSGSLVLYNKDLKDTELIHIGQVINIPSQAYSEEELASEKEAREKRLAADAAKNSKLTDSKTGTKTTNKKTYYFNAASEGYLTPIGYKYVSQYFSGYHPGQDMVAGSGAPIKATKSGCIITMGGGWNGGYGNMIVQDLGGGITARYAHLSAFAKGISTGSCVDRGDVIGYEGSTGRSTGPHLHFELRKNGIAFNPGM